MKSIIQKDQILEMLLDIQAQLEELETRVQFEDAGEQISFIQSQHQRLITSENKLKDMTATYDSIKKPVEKGRVHSSTIELVLQSP